MNSAYKLEMVPPQKCTPEQRQVIEQIYAFRKEAGKLYRFDANAGHRIKAWRKDLFRISLSHHLCRITYKKYGIDYVYNPDMRKGALAQIKELIKEKRQHLREWHKELSQTGLDTVSGIHHEPNGVINWFYKKLLSKAKYPITADTHIGIEIECFLPEKQDLSKLKDMATKISIIGDGSIRAPKGYHPQEIRLLTTTKDYEKDISKTCEILREMKADVNESCGLHVHLDMRNIARDIVQARFINLVRSQKYLQGMVTEKRRLNTYCKPTRACDPFSMRDRYHAINGSALSKYSTIEIRLHHGTIDATEIINWVTLLESAIKAEPIKRCPSTLESFMKKLNLEEKLAGYVKEKIAKNVPVVSSTVPETDTVQPTPAPVSRRCTEDHGDEVCRECDGTWSESHDGHMCYDEDGTVSDVRGSFPGCVRELRIPTSPIMWESNSTISERGNSNV